MKGMFFGAVAACTALIAAASPATTNGVSIRPNIQQPLLDAAKAAAKRNDLAGTENAITAILHAPANSHQGHIETAKLLMQVTHDVPREGKTAIADQLVGRILTHLELAFSLANTAREQASARALQGIAYERFSGNPALAVASYRLAAQLDPTNENAKAAADRLQRTLDKLAAKIANNRRKP